MANSVVVLGGTARLKGGDAVRLSRKQRAVVSYIEHNPKFAAFATAGELGGRVGVQPPLPSWVGPSITALRDVQNTAF